MFSTVAFEFTFPLTVYKKFPSLHCANISDVWGSAIVPSHWDLMVSHVFLLYLSLVTNDMNLTSVLNICVSNLHLFQGTE